MLRKTILVLVLSLGPACVRVPSSHPTNDDSSSDAGWPDELAIDGGPRRPDAGAPYRGPECDPEPESTAHAGQVATAEDAGDTGAAHTRSDDDANAEPEAAADSADQAHESEPAHAGGAAGSPSAMPDPAARHPREAELIITEIMSNPAAVSDTAGEWFELYNPSASDALDIGGCGLEDGSAKPHAIPAPFVIEAGEYVAIARGAEAGFTPDLALSFSLGNTADALVLRCDGREIDRVAYGVGFPLAAGVSMSLDPSATAEDNDVPGTWCLARTSYGADLGTPGEANPPCEESDAGLQ
jgi:hypothetical protein